MNIIIARDHAPQVRVGKGAKSESWNIFFWSHLVYSESYGVDDAHDGAINGRGMAGHVKICRQWDHLFKKARARFFSHATSSTLTVAHLHWQPFFLSLEIYNNLLIIHERIGSSNVNACREYFYGKKSKLLG